VDDAGKVLVWSSTGSNEVIRELEGHGDCVSCVDFSHDGSLLATKSKDGWMRIWRCDTWQPVATVPETNPAGWGSLEFHPREDLLATLGEDEQSVRIWGLDPSVLMAP
jgi:WD40 repeat protein